MYYFLYHIYRNKTGHILPWFGHTVFYSWSSKSGIYTYQYLPKYYVLSRCSNIIPGHVYNKEASVIFVLVENRDVTSEILNLLFRQPISGQCLFLATSFGYVNRSEFARQNLFLNLLKQWTQPILTVSAVENLKCIVIDLFRVCVSWSF